MSFLAHLLLYSVLRWPSSSLQFCLPGGPQAADTARWFCGKVGSLQGGRVSSGTWMGLAPFQSPRSMVLSILHHHRPHLRTAVSFPKCGTQTENLVWNRARHN